MAKSKAREVTKEEYDRLRAENNGRPPKGVRNPYIKDKDFSARPENTNKNGAQKSIQTLINRMKNEDFQELDKKSLMELYRLMFNTPKSELKRLMKNKQDIPFGVEIIWDNLQDPKTRAKAWAEYQTWVFGKAPNAGEMKEVQKDFDFENLSPEEEQALEVLMRKNIDEYSR